MVVIIIIVVIMMVCKEAILNYTKREIERGELIRKLLKYWSLSTIEFYLRELVDSGKIKKIRRKKKIFYKRVK